MAMKRPLLSKLLEDRGMDKIDSVEFMEMFSKFDQDGNNYMEGKEVDLFILDLFKRVYNRDPTEPQQPGFLSRVFGSSKKEEKGELEKFKDAYFKDFLQDDGKIDLKELADILPLEESLDVKFRCKTMTSVDFMKIWNRYDQDGEGFLSEDQLRGFTADYMGGIKSVSQEEIDRQVQNILDKMDKDKDGVIDLEEMANYLRVEDNFLRKFKIKKGEKLGHDDFNKIWAHYDKDQSGEIKGAELDALIRDIFTKLKQRPPSMDELKNWRDIIMRYSDDYNDGSISKEEMNVFFVKGVTEAMKRISLDRGHK